MRLQLYPCIQNLYQEMYRQATMHKSFQYKSSRADRILTCKFIRWLNKKYRFVQITESLLIQYFEFQFSRYSGVMTPSGKNNVMMNWIIGPKAIRAWEKRDVKKRWLVRWRINKDFRLQLLKFLPPQVKEQSINDKLLTYEEQAKQRFYNTPEGYLYCAQTTTLYRAVSPFCADCNYQNECRERLKLTYPNLYDRRRTDTFGVSH